MKVMVITRQLPGCAVVVHAVIGEPKNEVDSLERYFNYKANQNIERFREQFVEFNEATFKTIIMDVE